MRLNGQQVSVIKLAYGSDTDERNAGANAKIIQQWAIATTTNTFYLHLFESPEKGWALALKFGEEMIK